MVQHARASEFSTFLEQALGTILHPSRRDDPALRDINLCMGLAVGLEGLARQAEAVIGRPDSRPGLASLTVPTLVLAGDSDPLMPLIGPKGIVTVTGWGTG